MDVNEALDYFVKTIKRDRNISEAVCAIETLIECLKNNKNTTVKGLLDDLERISKMLPTIDLDISISSVSSASELFLKHITLAKELQYTNDFDPCKEILIKRGSEFLTSKKDARNKIASFAKSTFIKGKILVHSYSRVVLHILKHIKTDNMKVYVTESRPDFSGKKMFDELVKEGIEAILILDSAVGYILEQVDVVLMGAEVVCQSGGSLNKIGSYSIAMCAKALNRPVFIAAESYKFATIFPLNNRTIPKKYLFPSLRKDPEADVSKEHPIVDYVPPALIDYFLTDLGILTPGAVCDVLVSIYT